MIDGLQFASPAWFWALFILIPLLALRIVSQVNSGRQTRTLIAERLRTKLIDSGTTAIKWTAFFFNLLALVAVITALARPQWGEEEVEAASEGRSIIIAMDTSRSMLATDLVPNRLIRAQLAAKDLVSASGNDRIGIIAFAGRAFLQAPLTLDHASVIESIDQIDTEIIPRGGTNLTEAIKVALEAFEEAESGNSALVIFSDGEALEGLEEVEAIKAKAAEAKMTVITVGVGTESGSIIPELGPSGAPIPGEFIKDSEGNVVRSRLDATALRQLVRPGNYLQLGGRASLLQAVDRIKTSLHATDREEESSTLPIERFIWPLGFALVCFILAYFVPLVIRPSK
ncbi:MAG: VWA domain-containing protein [Verrucomicrobiota bacterium]